MITKIKNKNGEIFYYEDYDEYETVPEIVDKNKNNIQYLKAIAPEDLRPLILNNERNITTNTNDIGNTQNKINELEKQVEELEKEISGNWENITFTNDSNSIYLNEPLILFSKIKLTGIIFIDVRYSCFFNDEFEINKIVRDTTSKPLGTSNLSTMIGSIDITLTSSTFNISMFEYKTGGSMGDITDTSYFKIEGIRKQENYE